MYRGKGHRTDTRGKLVFCFLPKKCHKRTKPGAMSSFGPHHVLNQQKKRNFIYNPNVNRTSIAPSCSDGILKHELSKPDASSPQPRKKLKSRHTVHERGSEELAVEEVCRDLPLDAFDDDLECGMDDDEFDDEILTAADQLEEFERMASVELDPVESCIGKSDRTIASVENTDLLQESKYKFLDHNVANMSDTHLYHTKHPQELEIYSAKPYVLSDRSEKSHQQILTRPQQSAMISQTEKETNHHSVSSRSEVLNETAPLFSSRSQLTGTAFHGNSNHGNGIVSFRGDVQEDNNLVQALKKEIENLKNECGVAEERIEALNEEKFGKDGEIKILRDSLEHFRAEETRRQREKRDLVDQRAREQSEREKDLEKQIDRLTTRIQFKEQEITQMSEQNKKLASAAAPGNANIGGSPQTKSTKLGDTFPTDSSFFQRTSPQPVKSPRGKPFGREVHSPQRKRSEVSENSHSEGMTSSCPSTPMIRRQAVVEKEQMQLNPGSSLQVELVQKLLAIQDGERHGLCWNYDTSSADDDSILSVLKFNPRFLPCEQIAPKTASGSLDIPQTLHLFETQLTSKASNITGQRDVDRNYSQALHGLRMLLSESSFGKKSLESGILAPGLTSAINLLPLLESHILLYVEERTCTTNDSLSSTCQPRNSPSPDSADQKEATPSEADQMERLAFLCDVAVKSLQLLNILILYSSEVREVILRSCRVFDSNEEDRQGSKEVDVETEEKVLFSFVTSLALSHSHTDIYLGKYKTTLQI